jgi:hypothetical protein
MGMRSGSSRLRAWRGATRLSSGLKRSLGSGRACRCSREGQEKEEEEKVACQVLGRGQGLQRVREDIQALVLGLGLDRLRKEKKIFITIIITAMRILQIIFV